jgi:hypothetical protein
MCTPGLLWETPEVTTAANAMCQLANEPSDPPLSSDHGPGCRTAPAAPTGVMCTPGLRWETPEVTTVRAAIRTMAACQLANKPSDPPLSSDRGPGCRTAPAAPTGVMCTLGLLWETPEVTTVRAASRTNAMHESFAAAANRGVAPPTLATQFVDSNTGNSSQSPVFACLKTRHGLCNSPVPGL